MEKKRRKRKVLGLIPQFDTSAFLQRLDPLHTKTHSSQAAQFFFCCSSATSCELKDFLPYEWYNLGWHHFGRHQACARLRQEKEGTFPIKPLTLPVDPPKDDEPSEIPPAGLSLQETYESWVFFSSEMFVWCCFRLKPKTGFPHGPHVFFFPRQERPPSVKSLGSLPSSSPFTLRQRHYAGALVEISAQWRPSSSAGLRNCAWNQLYWNALWLIIFSF